MNKFIRISISFALLASCAIGQRYLYNSRETAITRAIEEVSPAVAAITVVQIREIAQRPRYNDPFFQYFFPFGYQRQKVKGSGSGVVISPDGYVLTNDHVIDQATEIVVTLPGGKQYNADVIGSDKITDLALLKLKGSGFPYARFGNSSDLMRGEWAIALGNPYGLFDISDQPTATVGIISAVHMDFGRQESGQIFQDMIQTDASINPGNSGGPLVNANGEVIGINTFIYTGSDNQKGSIGIGFAIPINRAREIAEELKKSGRIDRSFSTGLQIQPMSRKLADYLETPVGVIIVNIDKGSMAEQAGLQTTDVITTINGSPVKSAQDIYDVIEKNYLRPGDKIVLEVYRGGKRMTIKLELGKFKEK